MILLQLNRCHFQHFRPTLILNISYHTYATNNPVKCEIASFENDANLNRQSTQFINGRISRLYTHLNYPVIKYGFRRNRRRSV